MFYSVKLGWTIGVEEMDTVSDRLLTTDNKRIGKYPS